MVLVLNSFIKSPFYNPTQTEFQQNFNEVQRSINRANYINREFAPTKSKLELPLTYDIAGEFLMMYSVGTPPFKVYGILDIGSDLTWLQCKPCNICYNQASPIFDPSKSLSYRNMPCSSRTCKFMEITSCSYDGDACKYTLEYDPGSKTQGDVSMDTLTLHSTTGYIVSFPKTVIGCGHTNTWSYSYKGKSSGVIGFGKGDMSIIKQLGSSIDGKFSYCLIVNDYYRQSNLSSKLNFGDAAIVSGDKVVSTPMFKREGTNASTHNIMIDSGSSVTILPRHFFNRLESAVKKVVKLERFQDQGGSYSLCYNTTSKQQPKFPVITAHFSGADVKLDSNGAFASILKDGKCFAFRPNNYGLGLFGMKAQMNHLIGYDLKRKIVSFKPTDYCDPFTLEEATDDENWRKTMNEEINAIKKNKTLELTELPADKKAIGVKWVYKSKYKPTGEIDHYKARLDTIRMLILISAQNSWKIHQINVKSQFLNGNMEEEVYVKQPA
ncbi:aspartic proteinase CDR1-like [Vicia villosa]|uniref:aspartic proteinase CDR1-like n=1 Tax=Vicia villosa TaxID=3911 RepID=UPI00273B5447|nr:aspartic proteinase CDR1-like [Vicia villosa]